MGQYSDNCEESYSEGYDDGREVGYGEGYDAGVSDAKSDCEDEVVAAVKHSKIEMEYDMDVQREAFQKITYDLMEKVKRLNATIYELRKENATITRSIQKNSKLRN